MKTLPIILFSICFFILGNPQQASAQRHLHYHNRVVIKAGPRPGFYYRHPRRWGPAVVISPYRPARVVVYHPFWGPNYAFNRRWVFFPRYNIYWDNWRNQYVFLNNNVWVSQPQPPPVIVNVNLSNEKHYELGEKEDDVDDIYQSNSTHQSDYK